MKNKVKLLIVLSAVICGLCLNSANASQVAYVDIPKVVSSSAQVKALKKENQAKAKELLAFIEKARKDVAKVEDTQNTFLVSSVSDMLTRILFND